MDERPPTAKTRGVRIPTQLVERLEAAAEVTSELSFEEVLVDVLNRGLAPYESLELEPGVRIQADEDLPDDCIMIDVGDQIVTLVEVDRTDEGLVAVHYETGQRYRVHDGGNGIELEAIDDSDMP